MQTEFILLYAIGVIIAVGMIITIFTMLLRFGISRNKTQVKLKAIEMGMPSEPFDSVDRAKDPYERMASSRRNGIIAIAAGLGLLSPFLFLSIFVGERLFFIGGVAGLIPIFVGIGLLIDARLRRQDLENSAPSINFPQRAAPGSEVPSADRNPADPATVEQTSA